ncbi:Lipase 2 [Crateriforma conspicua]|uniref:Lipase 2 n=2 Tax=Planctomycetaceae TaxID=126 RepID=A0A5C6FSG9_9PLAN|nr:Lipase 2 [Crateriforma conspicua]
MMRMPPMHRNFGTVAAVLLVVMTVAAAGRQGFAQTATSSPKSTTIPKNIVADLDVVYAEVDGRKLHLDLFRPAADAPPPILVVVHGGGWLKGDKEKFRALSLRFAERGYATAAVEYRLGGEARFPAAIRDCNAAVAFLRHSAERYGLDATRLAAVGGSAGGHLVGLMAAGDDEPRLRHPGIMDDVSTHLDAAVIMAGPLQMLTGSVAQRSKSDPENSNAVNWIGGDVDQNRDLYQLADAHQKIDATMPPTLFICGSLDSPDRNEATREKMRSLGRPVELIVHPDAKHGHWNRPEWILRVVDDIDGFLSRHGVAPR